MEPPRDINVAVGILSTLSSFSRRALSTAAHSSMRRNLIRNTTRGLHAPDVALRFLVAAPAADKRRGVGDYASRFRSEQMAHGDLLLLNMTEHFLLCPLKYLLWLRIAPSLFPSAVWIASGDDDVYLQLEHLSAELHLVATLTNANEHPVLWGLITWKAFMNSQNCVWRASEAPVPVVPVYPLASFPMHHDRIDKPVLHRPAATSTRRMFESSSLPVRHASRLNLSLTLPRRRRYFDGLHWVVLQ